MAKDDETFFTAVGCMDGRVQEPVTRFGKEKFGAKYPDTITEPGMVGILARLQAPEPARQDVVSGGRSDGGQANNPSQEFLYDLKKKLNISIRIHHSKGIIVHGHQECAGNPIDDKKHREDVQKSARVIQDIINSSIPVVGVFIRRMENNWFVEEV